MSNLQAIDGTERTCKKDSYNRHSYTRNGLNEKREKTKKNESWRLILTPRERRRKKNEQMNRQLLCYHSFTIHHQLSLLNSIIGRRTEI